MSIVSDNEITVNRKTGITEIRKVPLYLIRTF